jgi:hypothetical protein
VKADELTMTETEMLIMKARNHLGAQYLTLSRLDLLDGVGRTLETNMRILEANDGAQPSEEAVELARRILTR